METRCNCGVCGVAVESPPPDPLNQNGSEGVTITLNSRNADGEPIAQYWHSSCRAAELRRGHRRGNAEGQAGDVAVVDWGSEIRGVLDGAA